MMNFHCQNIHKHGSMSSLAGSIRLTKFLLELCVRQAYFLFFFICCLFLPITYFSFRESICQDYPHQMCASALSNEIFQKMDNFKKQLTIRRRGEPRFLSRSILELAFGLVLGLVVFITYTYCNNEGQCLSF